MTSPHRQHLITSHASSGVTSMKHSLSYSILNNLEHLEQNVYLLCQIHEKSFIVQGRGSELIRFIALLSPRIGLLSPLTGRIFGCSTLLWYRAYLSAYVSITMNFIFDFMLLYFHRSLLHSCMVALYFTVVW